MLLTGLVKKAVTEKDLLSFAAHKQAGAHESASRKLKRSLSELNRFALAEWGRRDLHELMDSSLTSILFMHTAANSTMRRPSRPLTYSQKLCRAALDRTG
jgi:hypothetical protein